MLLSNFAAKTEINVKENKTISGLWPISLDYGFSGVKSFSPNKVFCFPNCAVKIDEYTSFIDASDSDIILKDKDGMWIVGEKAHNIISNADAMNYESEMYGRNRYFTPSFKALMKVGLAIALSSNYIRKYNGEPLMIETGLPPKYKAQDTMPFKEALAGDYDFELKIGRYPFQHFVFSVQPKNIFVMDQPMGSLISAITDVTGNQSLDSINILKGRTLVLDPGFKTFDIYDISSGMYKSSNTFDTLGMHEVFYRTTKLLKEKYGVVIAVPEMQKALRLGKVKSMDYHIMRSRSYDFEEEITQCCNDVCEEAVRKVLSVYNYLQDHDNMIVTGGTGDAWCPYIENFFKDMESLKMISANKNDPSLPNIYSNARGYYYFLLGLLGRNKRR